VAVLGVQGVGVMYSSAEAAGRACSRAELRRTKKITVSHDCISRLWRKFCLQPHRGGHRAEHETRGAVRLRSSSAATNASTWSRSASLTSRMCRFVNLGQDCLEGGLAASGWMH